MSYQEIDSSPQRIPKIEMIFVKDYEQFQEEEAEEDAPPKIDLDRPNCEDYTALGEILIINQVFPQIIQSQDTNVLNFGSVEKMEIFWIVLSIFLEKI